MEHQKIQLQHQRIYEMVNGTKLDPGYADWLEEIFQERMDR